MTEEITIKQCPFCWSQSVYVKGYPGAMWVECTECECRTVDCFDPIEKWNTRAEFKPCQYSCEKEEGEYEKKCVEYLEKINRYNNILTILADAHRDVIKLTYTPGYESNGWEYGISSDAIKKYEEFKMRNK